MFQSSQPAGGWVWLILHNKAIPSEVSIIPTRGGWVYGSPDKQHQLPCFNHPACKGLGHGKKKYGLMDVILFQSSQPIWVESCISFISRTNSVLQSSQPAGVGSCMATLVCYLYGFQSSQPAGVGSLITLLLQQSFQCFNHLARDGWVVF